MTLIKENMFPKYAEEEMIMNLGEMIGMAERLAEEDSGLAENCLRRYYEIRKVLINNGKKDTIEMADGIFGGVEKYVLSKLEIAGGLN